MIPLADTVRTFGDYFFDGLSGFIGAFLGVFGALVGVRYGAQLQRRHAREKEIEQLRFQIYMKLMDLRTHYDSCAIAQSRQQPLDQRIAAGVKRLSWEIADLLRQTDSLPEMTTLVRMIFLNTLSYRERSALAERVCKSLGDKINPTYTRCVQEIDRENNLHPGAVLNGISAL